MDVVTSRQRERFSASVDQVAPITRSSSSPLCPPYPTPNLQFIVHPGPLLQSIITARNPNPEVSCEFDLRVLLSRDEDELGANLSRFLSEFEIAQGSEEHSRIVREFKRVGAGIGPERMNQGLFALEVSILRVYTTYRCVRKKKLVRVPEVESCSVCLEQFWAAGASLAHLAHISFIPSAFRDG